MKPIRWLRHVKPSISAGSGGCCRPHTADGGRAVRRPDIVAPLLEHGADVHVRYNVSDVSSLLVLERQGNWIRGIR